MSDISVNTAATKLTRAKKPRLFYLDWIRAIAAILIVVTHFNNPYLEPMRFFVNRPFGIYIGGLGVSLFLIISGAALMYNYGDRKPGFAHILHKARKNTIPNVLGSIHSGEYFIVYSQ